MKKIVVLFLFACALVVSCKQKAEPKKEKEVNVIVKEEVVKEIFVDTAGNNLVAVYNTKTENPTVSITYDTYNNVVLTQTQSWAKGAEYKNGNLVWTTTKTGGNLILGEKTVLFSVKK